MPQFDSTHILILLLKKLNYVDHIIRYIYVFVYEKYVYKKVNAIEMF